MPHGDQPVANSSPGTREPDISRHKSRKLRAVPLRLAIRLASMPQRQETTPDRPARGHGRFYPKCVDSAEQRASRTANYLRSSADVAELPDMCASGNIRAGMGKCYLRVGWAGDRNGWRLAILTAVKSRERDSDGMRVPLPAWIAASLEVNEGRDPLGLQTTTQDRLMPVLLPGILELTRRARYFSFHAFLLSEYRARRLPTDSKSLSAFIKRREWEFGLAALRCPRKCGSSPVGARRLGRLQVLGSGPFPRGESVESSLGGYGLYYRTPLVELGIVARAGTLLGDEPIPIDVLYDTDRAQRLASTFGGGAAHHLLPTGHADD